jgi:hypothetical protein
MKTLWQQRLNEDKDFLFWTIFPFCHDSQILLLEETGVPI